jgi:uncharacterized protein (TIRG00374 family)
MSRDHLKLLAKFALAAALFYFLGSKGLISLEATKKAFSRTDRIVPAMLAIIATNLIGVVRWQWLLRAQNIRIPLARTFQLTFIGNFFNLALPGAISGDFVKAFYVARETHVTRGHVFGTILMDRIIGVSALVLVSATALALNFTRFWAIFSHIQAIVIFAASGALAFFTYLFVVGEHRDPLLGFLKSFERRSPKAGSLTRIYEGVRHYHHHRGVVARALLASFAIHVLVCFACVCFADALGDAIHPSLGVYVVTPMGLLVTAVPVTPAGVGTGHVAFGYLFQLLGSRRGADVFSLMILTQLLSGAVGGLIYLRFRSHEPKPDFSSAEPA